MIGGREGVVVDRELMDTLVGGVQHENATDDTQLAAAVALGRLGPKAAAATRESVARMVGRGHEDVDFAVLLLETARDAGIELTAENVKVDDGLAA